ncbi:MULTISPECIES: hypothetical protein [unclassified Sphingomonas]|uniref:hypothetical protein n=1 Tax=unclassified Sphingomonas TaxID=196159 RepID=UPI002150E5F1|nr:MULTISPECIES: hypothetical protein [unclassified Sphingomonas]MCR5869839.1 hypothetical protein [Sphingomonas sp. J344]UUX98460.1 hypothetical protein LRS08_12920 [Sphingomonas sp. J315]
MRMLLSVTLIALAAPSVSAQSADAMMPHPGQYMEPLGSDWSQRSAEKTADKFGQCVVRREPVAAAAFIDRALAERAIPAKPAALQAAVQACMPRRVWAETAQYVLREQDTAIFRAVRNSRNRHAAN